MNFGKTKCCGNCLQNVLDRENQANAPGATDNFALDVHCATNERSAATRLFGGGKYDKTDRLFKIDLGREWTRP